MARWLVQLEGDPSDLEEFPRWFPDGDVYALADNGNVYISGPALERLEEARHVHEAALQMLDEFSAIIALIWPSLKRPSIGPIYRDGDDGQRQDFVFAFSYITGARSKARAGVLLVNGEPQPQERQRPTQAQQLLAASRLNRHLQAATLLWADPLRTGPRLYRILEEIERSLKKHVDKVGFSVDEVGEDIGKERERFKHSINVPEAAGKDARHAFGTYHPPKNPMNLEEASFFIGKLLKAALRRAADALAPTTGNGISTTSGPSA